MEHEAIPSAVAVRGYLVPRDRFFISSFSPSMSANPSATAGRTDRAQPESFRARSINASLTVRDLQKSLEWYRDVAGFTVDQMYEREGKLRAVALKAGSVRFLINQDDGGKGWDRVKGEGFSLQFTTSQSIDDVANRIKARGGKLETEPADMPWGVRMFRLVDPDGYKIAISSERK
jgi:uncharacterized glyoxalase superfamily protein PhnB